MSGGLFAAELTALALALGFTVWVLVAQPMALVRTMPREKFVGLQMRVVRAWSRALLLLSAVVAGMAALRVGVGAQLAPAVVALAAAAFTAAWIVPRALRAGGASLRDDEDNGLDGARFLSEGGGDRTRVWHRAVLAGVALTLGGLALDAHDLLHAPHAHAEAPHAHAEAPHAHADAPRAVADPVTAGAIAAFERRAAALLAAEGEGSAAPLRAAWQNIFAVCTMQGEAHNRLHGFLAPMVAQVAAVEQADGAARLPALRALLGQLSRFDAAFVVAGTASTAPASTAPPSHAH